MLTQHHARCIFTFLGILLVFSLTVLAACSGSATETPPATPDDADSLPPADDNSTPPSSEAEEPDVAWVADGIINDDEYSAFNSYGDYSIYWRADEQYIYVGITAETTGWVAVAVQPGFAMKDADMVFGFVDGDTTTVYDLYSTGSFGPHSPDTELGGTDDILESAGSESNGFTTIEFKRALDTGDEYDLPLSAGVNQILWAYGSDDDHTDKHSARGYGEINL